MKSVYGYAEYLIKEPHAKVDQPEVLLDIHVLPTVKDLNAYSSKGKTKLEKLMDVLAEKDFFEPINLTKVTR